MRQACRSPRRWLIVLPGVVFVTVVSMGSVRGKSQSAAPACGVVQGQLDLDQIVARYNASREEYGRTFQDLAAEETKTIEVYRASGELEKRREIISDYIVYYPSSGTKPAPAPYRAEYRDVRSVDGKAVANRDARASKLLTSVSKMDSAVRQIDALTREGERFDFDLHWRGALLNQNVLPTMWRETYQVEIVGRESFAGHDVIVLAYQQTGGPGLPFRLPDEFGNAKFRLRGRLWLDVQNCQLWRSVQETAAPHPAAADSLVMIHLEQSYRRSSFGILVPERFVGDWREHFSHSKNGQPSFSLSQRLTLTYGPFKRFEVATRIIKIPYAYDR